jgi:nitrite reductase/ring-hydroxylating ferredoxin subunit
MEKNEMMDICSGCQSSGMDRRSFLSHSVLAAAALALAGCGADSPTAPASVDGSVSIAEHPALANVNGVALVSISGSPVAVVRTSTSTFVALSRICPHQGNLINVNGNAFLCSGHQAQFTLDGTWKGGQHTSNMRRFNVVFDATANTLRIT